MTLPWVLVTALVWKGWPFLSVISKPHSSKGFTHEKLNFQWSTNESFKCYLNLKWKLIQEKDDDITTMFRWRDLCCTMKLNFTKRWLA
jgi:hypothetical protein